MTGPDRPPPGWARSGWRSSTRARRWRTLEPPRDPLSQRFIKVRWSAPRLLAGHPHLGITEHYFEESCTRGGSDGASPGGFAVVAMPRLGSARGLGRLCLLPGGKITPGERFKALTHRRVTKAAAR